jgi:uncharacterized protein YegP (UPF0339 family)
MEDVRDLLARMMRHEAAVEGGAHFDVFQSDESGEFYFHLVAANNEIILASEGYTAKASAYDATETVRNHGRDLDSFEVLEASNGQFYFNLVAPNHEVIGTSELYVSESNAWRGAETVADLLHSERVANAE